MNKHALPPTLDLESLRRAYRNGLDPRALCEQLLERSRQYEAHNVWIHRPHLKELLPYCERLRGRDPDSLPLYGVPFAIKDNIDLAGVPTTAACPDYAYVPAQSATVVQSLVDAGAIPFGKTNMDQFATGLVGTRSPEVYGVCRNALNPVYISGGSSSGSAVAVALGLVSFALGTDTAGSGRVPAMMNNIYGLKPSRGLLGCSGLVPACRSLDCPSLFALSAGDLSRLFALCAEPDPDDAYSRANSYANGPRQWGLPDRPPDIAIPLQQNLEFFGNDESAALFERAVQDWRALGARIETVDIAPLLDAAKLLYEGPWVAERFAAVGDFILANPESVHPVVGEIIRGGQDKDAVSAFCAEYRMQDYRRRAAELLRDHDFLLTPTAPGPYRISEVLADPLRLNAQLGHYTNYMNLLDLCGIAVPAGLYSGGTGFGLTLVAPAFRDQALLNHAHQWQRARRAAVGVGFHVDLAPAPVSTMHPELSVAVCGAHLREMPLNWQLTERGGRFLQSTRTSPAYRLYALGGNGVARPGLVRNEDKGFAIDIELWSLPREEFGDFVANIPQPLGIGKVETEAGTWVSGFICEPWCLDEATDISEYGGWKSYLASR